MSLRKIEPVRAELPFRPESVTRNFSAGHSRAAFLAARLTCLAFILVLVLVSVVSLRWSLANPHISGWDQIQYIDVALKDALTRKLEGAGALRDALFNDYRWMPPGIRFLAMPLVLAHRVTDTDFRLLSLALFGLSLLVLFDAARRISNRAVAAGATALIAVAPVWVRATEDFMSETALIPAVAVVLWCLVRETEPDRPRTTPVLMGAALGFGMLARFSFAPMAAIVLAMLAFDAWRRGSWGRLLVAVLVATLVAWPSYAYNGVRYVAYGRFAATWPLDQMPGHGLGYAWNYVVGLAEVVLGLPLLVLPVAIILVIRTLLRPDAAPEILPGTLPASGAARRFIGVGCGVILLSALVPHIFGHNQNPRYLLGALPVLSLFLASGAGLRLAFVMGSIATAQAAVLLGIMLTGPYKVAPTDPTDRPGFVESSWRNNPTCDFSQAVSAVSSKVVHPVVKFYGVTGVVNHVQIELAFLRAGVQAHVIPADLATPDLSDPEKTGADMILVLNVPHGRWTHRFVADPNARVDAVREELLHGSDFVRSDARIGGPSEECTMDVFLARKT